MMKRKLLLVMSISLISLSIFGCSFNINAKKPLEDKKEQVENSIEKEQNEDIVNEEQIVVPSKEEIKEETKTKERIVKEEVEYENKDWSKAYDNFFNTYEIEKGLELSTTMEQDGVLIDMDIAFVNEETSFAMNISYQENEPTYLAMYNVDNKVYVEFETLGTKEWAYANVENKETAQEIMGTTDMNFDETINFKGVDNVSYIEEVEENGIIYDVLDVTQNTGENAKMYINRETQKIDKIVTTQDGLEYAFLLKEIDEITLPEEALNAKEVSEEDIAGYMFAAIMGAMSMGMEDIG